MNRVGAVRFRALAHREQRHASAAARKARRTSGALGLLGRRRLARLALPCLSGKPPGGCAMGFAPGIFMACALALVWYARGLLRSTAGERPSAWRTASFATGILAIYAVLDTRFEYLALHLFFLNRIQHVVMHHVGPFLVALAWPGPHSFAACRRRCGSSWAPVRFGSRCWGCSSRLSPHSCSSPSSTCGSCRACISGR